MELGMEKAYCCCSNEYCQVYEDTSLLRNCIFNLIIFEDEKKILFYNFPEKRIFKIEIGKGLKEIEFKEAIREIDIIPQKSPEWKKSQILYIAKELGLFG